MITRYKKNDILELDIVDMTTEGLGIGKVDGQVFFVKDAIIGDTAKVIITKVTSNVTYAKATAIIEESPYRVESQCFVANACGGCKLLNLNYKKQLELKKKYVFDCLSKIGKFNIVAEESVGASTASPYGGIFGMDSPYNFRNKMQVPYAVRNGKIIYGFYAGRTHHVVEFKKCLAGFEGAEKILDAVRDGLKKFAISIYDEKTASGVFREVMLRKGNESCEVSITYILNDKNYEKNLGLYKDFDEYIISHCGGEPVTSTININTGSNNVIFGNKNIVLRGPGYISDVIGDTKYRISPESFYQVNSKLTKVLYDKILEYTDFNGDENVLDLYCGIGTISLYIARKVNKVVGIEIVDKAIENAKENAKINGINNAVFICSDVVNAGTDKSLKVNDESASKDDNINYFDTVIVDPPRKGLDNSTIDYIKRLAPKKVIYVSCNPSTLARDLDLLCHSEPEFRMGELCEPSGKATRMGELCEPSGKATRMGELCEPVYNLVKLANVDMFPHTMHVETVALLSRNVEVGK